MKAITVNQLKTLPVGTILNLVWEDSYKEAGKSQGLMKIESINEEYIILDDHPEPDPEMAMEFNMIGDLCPDSKTRWEYPPSGIEFKLYLHETTNPII